MQGLIDALIILALSVALAFVGAAAMANRRRIMDWQKRAHQLDVDGEYYRREAIRWQECTWKLLTDQLTEEQKTTTYEVLAERYYDVHGYYPTPNGEEVRQLRLVKPDDAPF